MTCEEKNIEKMKEILGENLVTLVEYNNGDEMKCLAVCKVLDLKTITDIKKLKVFPVLFTKNEIETAYDIFPVEFLNIKKNHKLLYGEDLFQNIEISKEDLRKQLEFEFRSKLIHLRQSFLRSEEDELEDIILGAVPTLAPIIGALMYLKDVHSKYDPDLIKIMVGVDTKIVRDIHRIRIGKAKFEGDKSVYVERLINVLTQVGDIVDKLEIKNGDK